MKQHQILTGAANAGDYCFAVGHVDGIPFTAYGSGSNIVILASDFSRVQIIPGTAYGNIQVGCIDCSSDNGKIAASYAHQVFLFEPRKLDDQKSNHRLDYLWHQIGYFQIDSLVSNLSWNQEGTQLLTAGDSIQLWQKNDPVNSSSCKLDAIPETQTPVDDTYSWDYLWQCRTAAPVCYLQFSPDGRFFATAGKADRLVKIWYKTVDTPLNSSGTKIAVNYTFFYIAHPRAVTGFSWRKTSKYMDKGTVANMLVTSSRDNICRIWCETRHQESMVPPTSQNPSVSLLDAHTAHIAKRSNSLGSKYKRRLKSNHGPPNPLPSQKECHDLHKHVFVQATPDGRHFVHFHIAATINPATDMLPMATTKMGQFVVHWLNNKELHFTLAVETLLHEYNNKLSAQEETTSVVESQSEGDNEEGVSDNGDDQDEEMENKTDEGTERVFERSTSHEEANQRLIDGSEAIKQKINMLSLEWNQSSDMLFSIHPVDGSFLVWLVDFLDEYIPLSHRQPQVSFSSRIPMAFPPSDASTLCSKLVLYRDNLKTDIHRFETIRQYRAKFRDHLLLKTRAPHSFNIGIFAPNGLMVSKHNDGSLNQWVMTFAPNTAYSTVLSLSHVARCCGHRFQMLHLASHPELPLLLTSSHHNIPTVKIEECAVDRDGEVCRPTFQGRTLSTHISMTRLDGIDGAEDDDDEYQQMLSTDLKSPHGLCSELILWRVDPIGPLSQSGGVTELARVNSNKISAFSNIAWVPTLLPSSTLAPLCNSPSACFVASDGDCLKLYQSVIDARSLLIELCEKNSDKDSALNGEKYSKMSDVNVISCQSTGRPGCVIELDCLADSCQDWDNVLFMHFFQEEFILPSKQASSRKSPSSDGGQQQGGQPSEFSEAFFLVVLRRNRNMETVLHMWYLVLTLQPIQSDAECKMFSYDAASATVLAGDDEYDFSSNSSGASSPGSFQTPCIPQGPSTKLVVNTVKLCSQLLTLPTDVTVLNATPAASHLSSSSIYPACTAHYLMTTSCSDSRVRFWSCKTLDAPLDGDLRVPYGIDEIKGMKFSWQEWQMFVSDDSSCLQLPGDLVSVSCAYNGRIACAYKTPGYAYSDSCNLVNICIAIYECESNGGSRWNLEDQIHIENAPVPEAPKPNISSAVDRVTADVRRRQWSKEPTPSVEKSQTVPFFARSVDTSVEYSETEYSAEVLGPRSRIRKVFLGKLPPVQERRLVHLDWASKEDGTHILTISCGCKVFTYSPTSCLEAGQEVGGSQRTGIAHLLRQSSMRKAPPLKHQERGSMSRWVQIQSFELSSVDHIEPFPVLMSWVRDGVFIVGMSNEMSIFSQWLGGEIEGQHAGESRDLKETLKGHSDTVKSGRRTGSVTSLESRLLKLHKDSSSTSMIETPTESGLYEQARQIAPVLPQYHPQQLMELMNFGKVKRVKAILAHLVRTITGSARSSLTPSQSHSRYRTFSTSGTSPSEPQGLNICEEATLDYIQINAIPPLPLHSLLDTDLHNDSVKLKETRRCSISAAEFEEQRAGVDQDYSALFQDIGSMDTPDFDPDVFGENPTTPVDVGTGNLSEFRAAHAQLLTNHLTHCQLPGLTSTDQVHLLALADAIATTHVNWEEGRRLECGTDKPDDTIDDCGLRFHLATKLHYCLLKSLPPLHRAKLQLDGLDTCIYAWAFHSEAKEELLSVIPGIQKSDPTWAELRAMGVGWWLRSTLILRKNIEKVARAQFQANSDPLDAALFYMAMKKKNVIWGLYRSVSDTRMTKFFNNNFTEPKWRRAALKNAYQLLGKQRFQHAAAFFLLAGSLKDALAVCLNNLKDIQLALVICRLYEEDLEVPTSMKEVIYTSILGGDATGEFLNPAKMHADPFLRSISWWWLKEYARALDTLLETSTGPQGANSSLNPDVFNFYNYLRSHPLLMRRHCVRSDRKKWKTRGAQSMIWTSMANQNLVNSDGLTVDEITPLERRLYFATANAHFMAGCPLLALEVLTKLPRVRAKVTDDPRRKAIIDEEDCKILIDRGTIDDYTQQKQDHNQTVKDPGGNSAMDFDWGQTVSNGPKFETGGLDLDWSQPVTRFDDEPLVLDFGTDDYDDEGTGLSNGDSRPEGESTDVEYSNPAGSSIDTITALNVDRSPSSEEFIDIFAQSLKYNACLRIIMEELRTLATGFEVDGGELRCHLCYWLERVVDVLRLLCNYGGVESEDVSQDQGVREDDTDVSSAVDGSHIISVSSDFRARQERTEKRKRWLRANQHLLRTLLNYCSLYGASGGGLASVRMELILLLQELQQEKTIQQLQSPLPFPTTLPLLSASIASAKTVVSDPIRHLQNSVKDILKTVTEFNNPPILGPCFKQVMALYNLSAALSSCLYQSLCDSEKLSTAIKDNPTLEGFLVDPRHMGANSQLIHHRRLVSETDESPNSQPAKWPGVSSLQSLLAKGRDDDIPALNILLCESLLAVYVTLLIYGLAHNSANILYRVAAHDIDDKMWGMVFGGGIKHILRQTSSAPVTGDANQPKHRVRLNMKVLHSTQSSRVGDDRKYKEKFVAPVTSIMDFFLNKNYISSTSHPPVDYDSDDSITEDNSDDLDYMFDDTFNYTTSLHDTTLEHLDPNSYSWCLMRYAIVTLCLNKIHTFLPIAGIELPELPVLSPLLHVACKSLEQWQQVYMAKLEMFAAPPLDFIMMDYQEPDGVGKPPLLRYKDIIEPHNTPFKSDQQSALPVKRLWCYLVRQESVQSVFIKYIFHKQSTAMEVPDISGYDESDLGTRVEPAKILHKDTDTVVAFCVNQVPVQFNANPDCVVVATTRDVVEVNMSSVFNKHLSNTEIMPDINRPTSLQAEFDDEYILVNSQRSGRRVSVTGNIGANRKLTPVFNSETQLTTCGGSVIMRRPLPSIRQASSHPQLPYYLTGGSDGSVKMWEWTHQMNIASFNTVGLTKVTKLAFSDQGNKVMSNTTTGLKPFYVLNCHNKMASDFTFIGSSSFIATAGHSSENRNVCLWDTLLPQKSCLIQAFTCHDNGCPAIVYAPQRQLLISGGKKGEICIFDVRQRKLMHQFEWHDSAVRCLGVDPLEQYFVSGAAEGDIKVWDLVLNKKMHSFPGEHSRQAIFKTSSQGVLQLSVEHDNHIFSCGADGTLKLRILPDRFF